MHTGQVLQIAVRWGADFCRSQSIVTRGASIREAQLSRGLRGLRVATSCACACEHAYTHSLVRKQPQCARACLVCITGGGVAGGAVAAGTPGTVTNSVDDEKRRQRLRQVRVAWFGGACMVEEDWAGGRRVWCRCECADAWVM